MRPNQYSVEGTPADCARLALKQIAPDAAWLIAGINPGANLGSDVYNSGTVAAAREAAILGYRSIAVSQYIAKNHQINWDITGYHAAAVLKMLMEQDSAPFSFWNVNLPHPLDGQSSIPNEFCDLDINPHKYNFKKDENNYIYEGNIHERAMQAIPNKGMRLGDSSGKKSQLRSTPNTGIINFQILTLDTLIFGRCKMKNHSENATADKLANQNRAP